MKKLLLAGLLALVVGSLFAEVASARCGRHGHRGRDRGHHRLLHGNLRRC